MITVKTTGIDEVRKKLSEFTVEIREKVIDKALDNAADMTARNEAKEAPVNKGDAWVPGVGYVDGRWKYTKSKGKEFRPPGDLKKSIARIPRIKGSRDNKVRVIGPRSGSKYKNDGYHGKFVAQGTKHSKADAFHLRAASASESGVESIIVDAVDKAIRKLNR